MTTETRYFAAKVRPHGAQGVFARKVFELTVKVTGSHHAMEEEAINLINARGYELTRIISHSAKRDCV